MYYGFDIRAYKIGHLTFFTLDIAELFLEFRRIAVYFQMPKFEKSMALCLIVSWIMTRLGSLINNRVNICRCISTLNNSSIQHWPYIPFRRIPLIKHLYFHHVCPSNYASLLVHSNYKNGTSNLDQTKKTIKKYFFKTIFY